MNRSSSKTNIGLCHVCIKNIQEKTFDGHKKLKNHLVSWVEKVKCEICISVNDPVDVEAYLQSIEGKKLFVK